MKKLLTILTISLITSASIFAAGKEANVQLKTSIDETPVSYQLAYNGTNINDDSTYEITVAPLTSNGQTQDFTIIASSNMNSDLAVKVEIKPESFKTTLNGNTAYDSHITPGVNTINKLDTLLAGKQVNTLVNKFNLSWSGNSDLPAGNYTSNVKVEYSIQ